MVRRCHGPIGRYRSCVRRDRTVESRMRSPGRSLAFRERSSKHILGPARLDRGFGSLAPGIGVHFGSALRARIGAEDQRTLPRSSSRLLRGSEGAQLGVFPLFVEINGLCSCSGAVFFETIELLSPSSSVSDSISSAFLRAPATIERALGDLLAQLGHFQTVSDRSASAPGTRTCVGCDLQRRRIGSAVPVANDCLRERRPADGAREVVRRLTPACARPPKLSPASRRAASAARRHIGQPGQVVTAAVAARRWAWVRPFGCSGLLHWFLPAPPGACRLRLLAEFVRANWSSADRTDRSIRRWTLRSLKWVSATGRLAGLKNADIGWRATFPWPNRGIPKESSIVAAGNGCRRCRRGHPAGDVLSMTRVMTRPPPQHAVTRPGSTTAESSPLDSSQVMKRTPLSRHAELAVTWRTNSREPCGRYRRQAYMAIVSEVGSDPYKKRGTCSPARLARRATRSRAGSENTAHDLI